MTEEDIRGVQEGVVILATCVVQTLEETNPGVQEKFLSRLEEAQFYLREQHPMPIEKSTEMLLWTRELLTGFTWGKGQGKPFLSK
ncbi:hypothetical protein [Rhizobium sp. RM]|uniref:hypothetical protein n=1 Tax=Rhizobium sp. RM TaxID=2748079 RepID=UPI00110EB3A8|nr:hypothetical protein [Rhizobium sp. RM]NWJ25896.1 hypothetical protein [Rhizobium sp. RM]TMV15822.1 hypothetical protein BJG94_22095 [Rhizobium sp. Td3]